MESVVYLAKEKWADGINAGVEYVYTLPVEGDVEAIQGLETKWYKKIKSAQTMGGLLQLWIDELPDIDVPIRVFWDEKNRTYEWRIVKRKKIGGKKRYGTK